MKTPNTLLDEFLTYHLLGIKLSVKNINSDLLDVVLEKDALSESPVIKNVCAKLSVHLSDRIDETCDMLGISKRLFIENALIEALNRTDELCVQIDPFSAADLIDEETGGDSK